MNMPDPELEAMRAERDQLRRERDALRQEIEMRIAVTDELFGAMLHRLEDTERRLSRMVARIRPVQPQLRRVK